MMEPKPQIVFPPFRLDTVNQCLWREGKAIALTPKAYALLRYLVERAGQFSCEHPICAMAGALTPGN